MKLRFEVDQADSFRRGIDRPKSIVSIEVNPADIPESDRSLIAEHLSGIDVLHFYYHYGEIIKGYPVKELSFTSREPNRIVAKAANLSGLVDAIKENDAFIHRLKESFNHPVQLRLLDKPPQDEANFAYVSSQLPNQLHEIAELVRKKRRIYFECFLSDIQESLNRLLNEHCYRVYLLPLPQKAAEARFYCDPIFAAEFSGKLVVAHTPNIVLNRKTGRVAEATNLFHALDIYMVSGLRPGAILDDVSILSWEDKRWVIIEPESLIDAANDAKEKSRPAAGQPELEAKKV